MSKHDITVGGEHLDEIWHSPRSPRRFPGDDQYVAGLDVLGVMAMRRTAAPPPAPAKQRVVTPATAHAAARAVSKATPTKSAPAKNTAQLKDKANRAANRALAAGNKLARSKKYAAVGRKLAQVGRQFMQKTATSIHGDVVVNPKTGRKYQMQSSGGTTGGAAVPGRRVAELLQAVAADYQQFINTVDAAAVAGEIIDAVSPVIDQLVAIQSDDLARKGAAIADRAADVINNYDPSTPDPSAGSTVTAIKSDADAWLAQAQQALASGAAAAPPASDASSPGGGGGGGGGGGSDEGGSADSGADSGAASDYEEGAVSQDSDRDEPLEASEAVARFRATGEDPFEELDAVEEAQEEASDDEGESVEGDNGFDMNEVPDLVLDGHSVEITDAEPDVLRRSASMHHGAAYLQEYDYPPGGASTGQDDYPPYDYWKVASGPQGVIMSDETNEEVMGGCSYARGLDVLGAGTKPIVASRYATPRRAGFVKTTSPVRGRTSTSLVVNKPRHGDHAASIKNARDAGKRAVAMSQKILTALKKTPPLKVPAQSSSAASTALHGVVHRALGAAQLKKLAQKTLQAGKDTLKAADKHSSTVSSDKTRMHVAIATAQTKTKLKKGTGVTRKPVKKQTTKVRGEELEMMNALLGSYVEILGEEAVTEATANAVADVMSDAADAAATGDAPTIDCGPIPTMETVQQDLLNSSAHDPGPEGDQATYSSDASVPGTPLPEGAVFFDGSRSIPDGGLVSFNRAYGTGEGFNFQRGGWRGGGVGHSEGWMRIGGPVQGPMGAGSDNTIEDSEAPDLGGGNRDAVALHNTSQARLWGPLVGSPNGSTNGKDPGVTWQKGLRYDVGGNRWFWFRDRAPSWATSAGDMVLLNQAILDWKSACAAQQADAAAQAAQDLLDQKQAKELTKQQAAEDAQMARQQQQEQAQAEHEAALQSKADELSFTQAQKQQELDMQQASAMADIEAKQASSQADIEAKAAETAARIQAMQPQGGGDQGDDGEAPPDDNSDDAARAMLEAEDEGEGESVEGDLEAGEGDDGQAWWQGEGVLGLGSTPSRMTGADRLRMRRYLRR